MMDAKTKRFQFAACWVTLILLRSAALTQEPNPREAAVEMARAGQTEPAILALRHLLQAEPQDPLVAFDLAVILTWAGQPKEAIEVFESVERSEVPTYVLAPLIGAYRNQKRFSQAEKWAREGQKREAKEGLWPKLLGLILADQKRGAEARSVLEPRLELTPEDPELWNALGYAARQSGDRFEALHAYGQALRLQATNSEAAQSLATSLLELGAPYGAGALLEDPPLLFPTNQVGLDVRWAGQIGPRDPRHRFDSTDEALARLDQLIDKADQLNDRANRRTLELDRIIALRQRERWSEVLSAVQRQATPPPYVREAQADALLALHRPEEARSIYRSLVKLDPQNTNAQVGLFFALTEEEDFSGAFAVIDELAKHSVPGIRLPKMRVTQPNDLWLQWQTLAAQGRSFAEMPAAAWNRLHPLAAAAPANSELRAVLSELAADRGWPRRAAEEIEIAASLNLESKSIQLGLAQSAMRRQRWSEARSRLADLQQIYPNDNAVGRTLSELAIHDSAQWESEVRVHHEASSSSGANTQAPGSSTEIKLRLWAPPLLDHLRFFGTWENSTATLPEGFVQQSRDGAGLEWRLADWSLEAIGWNNHGALAEFGASLNLSWEPTDHWTLRAKAERFALDTPLRALFYQTRSDALGVELEYRWHEARAVAVSARAVEFTDGNHRRQWSASFTQKLLDRPHFDLEVRPEVFFSQSSNQEVPYFSPEEDLSATVSLSADHLLWRRYTRSFAQRWVLNAGGYWQKGFSSAAIGSALYEQVYQHSPSAEIHWGIELRRAVYDGQATPSIETFCRVSLRF